MSWNVINAYCGRCGKPGSCVHIDGAPVCTGCRRPGDKS